MLHYGREPFGGYEGFAPPVQRLRTATGNPAVLSRSVAGTLRRVTVYGADGGVGDATVNICAPASSLPMTVGSVTIDYSDGIYTMIGRVTQSVARAFTRISVKPSTKYTFAVIPVDGSAVPITYAWDGDNSKRLTDITRWTIGSFTTESNGTIVSLGITSSGDTTTPDYKFRVMVVEGTYTAQTMPDFEPYGYKLPVMIGNKTAVLYSPQQLTAAADMLAADIAAQTATLTAGGVSTDVSDLQDWEQDFTLAKGDNTVSVDTEVQPSRVEWRYLSRR